MEINNINIGASSNNTFEVIVKQLGEPIMVPPAEETKSGLYFLSNFDQLHLNMYTGTAYCYKSGNDEKVIEEVIKEALSKVLIHYYPVAGRLRFSADSQGKVEVDCNGEGAMLVVAETDCVIDDIIHHANFEPWILSKLLYEVPISENMLDMPLLVAQVTKFRCGGFVLGLCMNHALFDGLAAMDFINLWSEIARDLPMKDPPLLDRTVLKSRQPPRIEFPHHEFAKIKDVSNIKNLYEEEETIYKSFLFSPKKLEIIKKKATEDHEIVAKCTTFEALSGLIWRIRTQALKLNPNQQTRIVLAVNGRSKLDPPLNEKYVGNCVVLANSLCSADKLVKNSHSFAVGLVQEAIKMVTNDYIRSTLDYVEMTRAKYSRTPIDLMIVSWIGLSFHTTDFGWGRPVFAGRASLPQKEAVYFLDVKEKEKEKEKERSGINVLLGLPTSSMKIFQQLLSAHDLE